MTIAHRGQEAARHIGGGDESNALQIAIASTDDRGDHAPHTMAAENNKSGVYA
jgi:hypothetical protein